MTPAEIQRLFEEKEIEVEIDACFLRLKNYPVCGQVTRIKFKLLDLILAFGTLHPSRFQNSNRIKIADYFRYLDRVKPDVDFKIDFVKVRQFMHSDGVLDTSYFFGSSLSLLLADKLFRTQVHALRKITGSKKRADYEGYSSLNHYVVLEAKGTSYDHNRPGQITKARSQIATKNAFIKIISSSLLNENSISNARLIDPPGEDVTFDENQDAITKAQNFSNLFNLLGHQELSHYFYLMMGKIQNQKNWAIVDEKEKLFEKIVEKYDAVNFHGIKYRGLHYKDGESFLFVGVKEELIYFKGFLDSAREIIKDQVFEEQNRFSYLYLNSILLIVMKGSQPVQPNSFIIDNDLQITMNDIHYSPKGISNDLILKVFIRYSGFELVGELPEKDYYLFIKDEKRILVAVKRFFLNNKKKSHIEDSLKKLGLLSQSYDKVVILSPNKLPKIIMQKVNIFDRKDLSLMIDGRLPAMQFEA